MPSCECWERLKWKWEEGQMHEKRNLMVAAIAGAMFFSGWWIIFDVTAQRPSPSDFQGVYYICGITNTLSIVMVNLVSRKHLRGDVLNGGCIGPCGALGWLFIGFTIGFASLIASGWILFVGYVIPNRPHKWYGAAIFIQNLLIFLSGLIYKFGRSEDLWGM